MPNKMFATPETPPGFPMAISEYLEDGEEPRTLAELTIMQMAAAMQDKKDWWIKIFDNTILDHWEHELFEATPKASFFEKDNDGSSGGNINDEVPSGGDNNDDDSSGGNNNDDNSSGGNNSDGDSSGGNESISEEAWNFNYSLLQYAIAETKWKARQLPADATCVPAAVAGVFCCPQISLDLLECLVQQVAVLRDRPAIGSNKEDRHPGTPQMIDLVHPSLYCYEQGQTLVLQNMGAEAIHQPDDWESSASIREDPCPAKQPERPFWMQMQNFESPQGLQWLPAEFWVNPAGTSCEIRSYINSLHPVDDADLYQSISELFLQALPLLEETLKESKAHKEHPTPLRVQVKNHPRTWWKPPTAKFRPRNDGENKEAYDQAKRYWEYKNRTMVPLEIPAFTPPPTDQAKPVFLRGRPLQVIVKLAQLEISPGEAYTGGHWHVEGALNERIVATACCYLESTNVVGGELAFRVPVTIPKYAQYDPKGIGLLYGLEEDHNLVQEIGHCRTTAGRILAWPNTLQHCVCPIDLVDDSLPGKRTICCFFLVDPTLRIRSTATVPPQPMAWYVERVRPILTDAGMTDEHLQDKVFDYVSAMPHPEKLTYEQACERRDRLMKERQAVQQGPYGDFYFRPFALCEH